MTPRQEAIELVDRFLNVDDGIDYDNGCGVTIYQAKQCALICVREIVNSHYVVMVGVKHSILQHYSQVTLEIHKL
jgi:hypothetical protein